MTLADIHNRQSAYQDSMLRAFEGHLRVIVMRAQGRVIASLQGRLSMTDGVIDQTAANIRLLRNLNNLFMRELDREGFPQLVESFVGEFQGQLPYLQEILDSLSKNLRTPLPQVKWTGADASLLAAVQANSVSGIETAMEAAAGAAMTRGMFAVGGLKFGDLVETLTTKLETSIGRARTIADTSMSTFYRTATDRAYQKIQAGQPEPLKYEYSGPDDKLTRPFCEHLLQVGKSYTRPQIDRMSNGQLPNCFLTGGGFNCRHNWILDTSALEVQAAEAA